MLEESTNDADGTEIENIDVTARLLRRMLGELQSLEVDNARLHFAMSNTRHAIRQRLDPLLCIERFYFTYRVARSSLPANRLYRHSSRHRGATYD